MTVAPSQLIENARRGFTETFDADPGGVWFAPGRINIIGEHTDYNEGFVLPFALDRGVVAAAELSNDGMVRLISDQTGPVSFAISDVDRAGPGLGHAESAIWAATGSGIEVPGLRVFVSSTVPIGAGLSSSSAFICGLLVAINDLTGHDATPTDLAVTAQRAETDGVGVPIGAMDPMVCMLSRQGHAMLLDCRSLEYEHIAFEASTPDTETEILIVDTRTERTLAAGEYAQRRRACQDAAAALGVASLRDASVQVLEEKSDDLDEVSFRRARHVLTENARVLQAVERIRDADVAGLGKLLDESHQSLAADFDVSSSALDLAVEVCRDSGAYGARLTGAGFGGCVIGLFPAGSSRDVEAALTKAFLARVMSPPRVLPGISGPSAGRVAH